MALDIPVPAPASWRTLAAAPSKAPQPPATDAPVLPAPFEAHRQWDTGSWSVTILGTKLDVLASFEAVVDDHGNLVALPLDLAWARLETWADSDWMEPAAWAWREAQRHAQRASLLAQMSPPARIPTPVVAEVITEPLDDFLVASIVVSDDNPDAGPPYSLHMGHEAPLLMTHSQLAALMLAGQQLMAQAPMPSGPRRLAAMH